jgi:hypothetical protein
MECAAEGEPLRNDRDAVNVISAALEQGARCVAIPVERLGDQFFDLRTRIAGEFIQKFVTYKIPLAIVGDISRYVAASRALHDFVYESNRGDYVWFLPNRDKLDERLRSNSAPDTAGID